MLKGITVTLYEPHTDGFDDFGTPVTSYIPIEVENVLVAPSSTDDIATSTNLAGKQAIYTLGIPKGDNHQWEDSIVEFFGHKFKTFAFVIEGIEELVPLQWHKKVMCERYE